MMPEKLVVAICFTGGLCLFVAGIHLLLGTGAALLAGAAALMLLAFVIARGMNDGQ